MTESQNLDPLTMGHNSLSYGEARGRMLTKLLARRLDPLDQTRHAGLTEDRDDPDFARALIDSWASVVDVLGFYQKRIADQCYLDSADEHWSLIQLARGVGRIPRSATSAITSLAFTIANTPGLDMPVTIPAGTSVRSVPLKGGQPQIFETSASLAGRVEWNAMRPALPAVTHATPIDASTTVIHVAGFPSVRVGDALLITTKNPTHKSPPTAPPPPISLRHVRDVHRSPKERTTRIGLEKESSTTPAKKMTAPHVSRLEPLGKLFGNDRVSFDDAKEQTKAEYGVRRNGLFARPSPAGKGHDNQWHKDSEGLPPAPITALASDKDMLFAATAGKGIYRKTYGDNNESAWKPINSGLTNKTVFSLRIHRGRIYAGTASGVFSSVDHGNQWDPVRGTGSAKLTTRGRARTKLNTSSTRLPSTAVRSLLVTAALKATDAENTVKKAADQTGKATTDQAAKDTESGLISAAEDAAISVAPGGPVVRSLLSAVKRFSSERGAAAVGSGPRTGLRVGDHGVDVSSHQPQTFNWAALKKKNVRFVIIRTTYGLHSTDEYYKNHRRDARAAGLLTGSYHFAYPRPNKGDATAQANRLLHVLDGADDLVPTLDFETDDKHTGCVAAGNYGLRSHDWADWILEFLEHIEASIHQRPMLYIGNNVLNCMPGGADPRLGKYSLWHPEYGSSKPSIHAPWRNQKGYALWQYSDSAEFGLGFPLDASVAGPDVASILVNSGASPSHDHDQDPGQKKGQGSGQDSSAPAKPKTDDRASLLAGTDQGIYRNDGPGTGWVPWFKLDTSVIHDLHHIGKKRVMAATDTGVYLMHVEKNSAKRSSLHGAVTALAEAGGKYYAATPHGLMRANNPTGRWARIGPKGLHQAVISLTTDGVRVFAATAADVWCLEKNKWRRLSGNIDWTPDFDIPQGDSSEDLTDVSSLAVVTDSTGPKLVAASSAAGYVCDTWPHLPLTSACAPDTVCLDLATSKAKVVAGQTVIVTEEGLAPVTVDVDKVETVSRHDFGMTAKVLRLHLNPVVGKAALAGHTISGIELYAVTDPRKGQSNGQLHPVESNAATDPKPPAKERPIAVYGRGRTKKSKPLTTTEIEAVVARLDPSEGEASSSSSPTSDSRKSKPKPDPHSEPLPKQVPTLKGKTVIVRPPVTEIPTSRTIAVAGARSRALLPAGGGFATVNPRGSLTSKDSWTLRGWDVVALAANTSATYAATGHGRVLKSTDGSTWTTTANWPSSTKPTTLLLLPGDSLLAGTSAGGLWLLDEEDSWLPTTLSWETKEQRHEAEDLPGAGAVNSLLLRQSARPADARKNQADPLLPRGYELLAGTATGVYLIDAFGRSRFSGLAGTNVHSLALLHDGDVVAGSSAGVFQLSATDDQWQPIPHYPGGEATAVAVGARSSVVAADAAGRIWRQTHSESWINVGDPGQCAPASALLLLPHNVMALGTRGDGIYFSDHQGGGWQHHETGLSNDITCLAATPRGLLAGTSRSSVLFTPHGHHHRVGPRTVAEVPPKSSTSKPDLSVPSIVENLDRGIVVKELRTSLPKTFTVPHRPTVRVAQQSLQWEIENMAPRLAISLVDDQKLRIEALPTTMPIVASSSQHAGGSMSLTLELDSGVHATVSAIHDEIEVVAAHDDDPAVAELATVTGCSPSKDGRGTNLSFESPLGTIYDAATVALNGNVVAATQGDTVEYEMLGNGDATRINQQFTLMKKPLSELPSGSTGRSDSLSIWVGHRPPTSVAGTTASSHGSAAVQWQEIPTLADAKPGEQVFMVQTDENSRATIIFGDGYRGARLPTGVGNVTACYRTGAGGATLAPGTVTVLGHRPVGVRSVVNPVATKAGTPPESSRDLREVIPRSTQLTKRIVSLDDYENFALDFEGVHRAAARILFDQVHSFVHLSVGGPAHQTLDDESPVLAELKREVLEQRATGIDALVEPYEVQWVAIAVDVTLEADAHPSAVRAAVRDKLTAELEAGAGERHHLIRSSKIEAISAQVQGVAAAVVTGLHRVGCPTGIDDALQESPARWNSSTASVQRAVRFAVDGRDITVDMKTMP